MFLGVAEDTINQLTNNGEAVHYNVFRKALTSVTGAEIDLPLVIGGTLNKILDLKLLLLGIQTGYIRLEFYNITLN